MTEGEGEASDDTALGACSDWLGGGILMTPCCCDWLMAGIPCVAPNEAAVTPALVAGGMNGLFTDQVTVVAGGALCITLGVD